MPTDKPSSLLNKARRTADYYRDRLGQLWKWTRKGWRRLKEKKPRS